MMEHIRSIGSKLRNEVYFYIPAETPVYLFMDNAGGHGKIAIKEDHERILKQEYNIQIEWQVPQSPETNMLDLGVWVSLQSHVERIHKNKVM